MKRKGKVKGIIVFILWVIVTSFLINAVYMSIFNMQSENLNNLKTVMKEKYYNQDNFHAAMEDTLGDIYSDDEDVDFDNYVYKLVMDDVNEHEPDKMKSYNRIFTIKRSEELNNNFEEAAPLTVETEGEICYIDINDFTYNKTYDMLIKNKDIITKSRKIIIDLRDNPGGNISELDKILSLFFDKGKNVASLVKADNEIEYYVSDKDRVIDFDSMVIVVNGKSASSSEAFTNTLKTAYSDKVTVIGERTYGKNFYYNYRTFESGYMFMYVAGFMGDNEGGTFPLEGIEPDIKVADDGVYEYAVNYLKNK